MYNKSTKIIAQLALLSHNKINFEIIEIIKTYNTINQLLPLINRQPFI